MMSFLKEGKIKAYFTNNFMSVFSLQYITRKLLFFHDLITHSSKLFHFAFPLLRAKESSIGIRSSMCNSSFFSSTKMTL